MNQKEIKALIFLFLLPLWIFHELLLVVFRCIRYIFSLSENVHREQSAEDGVYRSLNSKKLIGHVFLFLVPITVGAAIMSKNGLFSFWEGVGVIFLAIFFLFIIYQSYAYLYFNGEKFNFIKNSIAKHTKNCNELNDHINDLILTNLNFSSHDYGDGFLNDQSNFKFKRQEWSKNNKGMRIHNCSSSVLKNASNQPFKYLCKYFNVKVNEETLSAIELALNDVLAANQGLILLESERERIIIEMERPFPFLLLRFSKERLMKNLGFNPITLNEINFPLYTFRYVSSGGNSSYDFNIRLDIESLEKLIVYLGEIIKFRKTAEGQRALMTQGLREKIKCRDNYTCKFCGVSVMEEKNLLLEIDHIIPLSKGGITSENNLQTLCWKCNRSKGVKIL